MIKKTGLIALLMFVLSLPSVGLAATVGNTAETQGAAGKFSLGVEYDGVTNRDLKWKSGTMSMTYLGVTDSDTIPSAGDSIEDMEAESNRIFLKGTVGVHPNVDVFVKLGMADADWKMTEKSPGSPDSKTEFNGDWDLAYGIGAKAKLFQTPGGLRVMADAQYLRYEVDGKLKTDGTEFDQDILADLRSTDPNATFSSTKKTKVQEWQVALYVNKTIGKFSPYGGVKYSDFKADLELDGSGQYLGDPFSIKIDGKSEADKNFGIFLGTDIYVIPNKLSVNLEGRFIDETAFTIGANYKF
ncbi:hypothetical protein MNBD_NITROSPIRAE02-13 [hydrothermal vent metagenome]|uniref:Outer membrane protein beta-barrel domain-containing protein n=1 Tax=hydrothermal vent metagenome TaxID=652676 RepID=A0A3B1D2N6_9ZZZZ